MFGFGFAMVPFYRALCEAVGLNAWRSPTSWSNTQVDATRTLTVEFDTNLRNDLPWTFTPVEKSVRIHPGALTQVTFEIRNNSDQPVTGQAIPSYGPQVAARHFRKLECFCFTQQTLAPGEVRRMPVAFVIDAGAAAGREHGDAVVHVFRGGRQEQRGGRRKCSWRRRLIRGGARDRPPRARPDRCRS